MSSYVPRDYSPGRDSVREEADVLPPADMEPQPLETPGSEGRDYSPEVRDVIVVGRIGDGSSGSRGRDQMAGQREQVRQSGMLQQQGQQERQQQGQQQGQQQQQQQDSTQGSQKLVRHRHTLDPMDTESIFKACRAGKSGEVKAWCAYGNDANLVDFYGNSLLYYACLCGHTDIVKYLLHFGAKDDKHRRCWWNSMTTEIRQILTLAEQEQEKQERGELRGRKGSRASMFLPPIRSNSMPNPQDSPRDPPAGGSGSLIAAAVNLGFSAERAQYHIIHWGVNNLAELMDLLVAEDSAKQQQPSTHEAHQQQLPQRSSSQPLLPQGEQQAHAAAHRHLPHTPEQTDGDVVMRRRIHPSHPTGSAPQLQLQQHQRSLPSAPSPRGMQGAATRGRSGGAGTSAQQGNRGSVAGVVLPTYEESQQERDAEEFGFHAAFGEAIPGLAPEIAQQHAQQQPAANRTYEDMLEKDLCKICFERLSDVAFIPCGHLGFCKVCSRELRICPVCRTPIASKLVVFRV